MWVVRLSGSLAMDASLPDWLTMLTRLGGGRVTVVAGGGGFSDETRRMQARWQFDDLAAHNMAVLAMVQSACLMQVLNPALRPVQTSADIHRVLQSGRTALWLPFNRLQVGSPGCERCSTDADDIALDLARTLNAERLVLVKPLLADPAPGPAAQGAASRLQARQAALGHDAAFLVSMLHAGQLDTMRALLLGTTQTPPA